MPKPVHVEHDGGPLGGRPSTPSAPTVDPGDPPAPVFDAAVDDGAPGPAPLDAAVVDRDAGPAPLDAGTPGTLDASALATDVDAAVSGKWVFVTSSRHTGALSGLDGADAICAARASAAGLAGEYRAWLSTAATDAADRLTHADEPYVRSDGVPVADDWADLTDGTLSAPIAADEFGQAVIDDVWTGTGADGRYDGSGDCDGFSRGEPEAGGFLYALCGSANADTAAWTSNSVPSCTTQLRLYCLQQ